MKGKKNIENLNWELQAKYFTNEELSGEDLSVESWLNQSDKNREELEKSRQMLEKVDLYYKAKSFDSGAAWQNVHSKINPAQLKVIQHKKIRKEAILKFYKYAAILIIALLLGSVGYYIGFKYQAPAVYSEIISGENQVLNEYVLPDGSVVALNSNSQLSFPKRFKGDVREVTIVGEAFFDVKSNPEKPFVINAGNTQVKVLGTSFNVCAYPESETVEVVVETGKVQVIRKDYNSVATTEELVLVPGEKGILYNESKILEKTFNEDVNFNAWKTHDLIFNEVPLEEVILTLKKAYHTEIQILEPELNQLLYTAHFDKKPIDFILNVIRQTFNLELLEENEQFTLSVRNNEQEKL